MDLNDIIKGFSDINTRNVDYLGSIFIKTFKSLPKCYYLYLDKNDGGLKYLEKFVQFDIMKNKLRIDNSYILDKAIDYSKNDSNVKVFCYSPYEWVIIGNWNHLHFMMNITITDGMEYEGDYYEELFIDDESKIDEVMDIIEDWFIEKEKSNKIEFGIAAIDSIGNIFTSWFDYELKNIDIDINYNDDFPYKKICSLIESKEKPELLLFYGEPGTGKTSVIKHLLGKYDDKNFVFIDGSLLSNAPKEKLISYFLENNETVFILEDCEKSLVSRDSEYNPVMPILLNLTDGIIGDALGIKIICTFNTSLSKIDKALLRKGRLSLKYEFKKLDKKKVRKILNDESINEDMTLADIYYMQEENDFSSKNISKIGF